jgi:hypothetical protein
MVRPWSRPANGSRWTGAANRTARPCPGECKRLNAEGKSMLQETIALHNKCCTPEAVEDGTSRRISAVTGLAQQQVQTFQPFLVPIAVSYLAAILVSIDLEAEAPAHHTPNQDCDGESIEFELKPEPKPEPVETVIELSPRVPDTPKSRLAVTTRQPVGAVLDFLHGGTEIIAGACTELTDAFIGYAAWCKAKALCSLNVRDRFMKWSRCASGSAFASSPRSDPIISWMCGSQPCARMSRTVPCPMVRRLPPEPCNTATNTAPRVTNSSRRLSSRAESSCTSDQSPRQESKPRNEQ